MSDNILLYKLQLFYKLILLIKWTSNIYFINIYLNSLIKVELKIVAL